MVCFQTDYLHIEYHEPDKVLVSQWSGTCTSPEYRQALQESMHYSKAYHVNYLIMDRRLLSPLPEEDLQWTSEVFNQNFYRLPLKRFAIINAFNNEAEQQQQQLLQAHQQQLPFEVRNFEDLTSAYDWITVGGAK